MYKMTSKERFARTFKHQPTDRVAMWDFPWPGALNRWHEEGMPADMSYEELEKEGFIETVVGKGTFVSGANSERLKEAALAEMEGRLEEVIISAKSLGLSLDECIEILKDLYEEV